MEQRRRDLSPLTGALFVVLVVVAFFAIGGNTPEGDASSQDVVSFYTDNDTKEIIAALVLSLAAVSLLYFSVTLKGRLDLVAPSRSRLPMFALAGGIVASIGFLVAAAIHFALADYAEDIEPAAAQAINAIDSDFFLPFTSGLAVLVLATSILVVKNRAVLPTWMGWVGIVLFIVFFTPVGFVAFGLTGIWIIIASILLYRTADAAMPAPPAGAPPPA